MSMGQTYPLPSILKPCELSIELPATGLGGGVIGLDSSRRLGGGANIPVKNQTRNN